MADTNITEPALTAVLLEPLAVPASQVMGFAVRHDQSYPAVVAFVRLHRRLPSSLAEFQNAWMMPPGAALYGALA